MHWHGFSSVWVLQWQQTYTACDINAVSVVIGVSPQCPNTNFKAKFILPVRWANPSEITLNWVMWGLSILVLSNKWKSFVTIEPLLLFPSVISPMVYMDTSLLLTNLCPVWEIICLYSPRSLYYDVSKRGFIICNIQLHCLLWWISFCSICLSRETS